MKHIFRKKFTWAFTLALAALVVIPFAAFADVINPDGDILQTGDQNPVNLGTVAPGTVLTPKVSFTLACSGNKHVDDSQSVAINFSSAHSTVPAGSLSATNTTIGATTGPDLGVPASWPDDPSPSGNPCPTPAPTPINDNSDSTVTITAPSTSGTYIYIVKYDVVLSQVGSNDSASITGEVSVTFTLTVAATKANQTIDFAQPANPATYGSTFSIAPTASSGLPVSLAAAGSCSASGYNVTMTSGTGTCTLTASQAGDTNYNAATDVVRTVAAAKADQTITFAAPASPAVYNTSFAVNPTASSGLAVDVAISGVCSLAGNTVTMTSGTGTCTLTASQAGDDNYNAAADVVRTVDAAKADQTITFAAPTSPAVYNTSFAVNPTASSGLAVDVTVSGVCSLADNSVTMTSGTGTCTITAFQAGDDNYNAAADVSHDVDAAKADQTITFAAPASPAVYNTSFAVNPTASSGLAVDVTVSGVCSLAGNTVTMTSGTGTCTLTASQAGDDNYNAAADVVRTVTAAKADQTITFNALSNKTLGDPDFSVSASASSGLNVSFAAVGACSVSGSTVHITGVGSCTITASQAGDTNYNAATSVSRSFNVLYASSGNCLGAPGHAILQPINADGTSVFKQGSTVPAKFRVCDASGASIGTSGVVSSFRLVKTVSGTAVATVDEDVFSTTPDTAFRWDPTAQQWIFNISSKKLSVNTTYYYDITLNDGTHILFQFGLK